MLEFMQQTKLSGSLQTWRVYIRPLFLFICTIQWVLFYSILFCSFFFSFCSSILFIKQKTDTDSLVFLIKDANLAAIICETSLQVFFI